jgi:hypothetical protein
LPFRINVSFVSQISAYFGLDLISPSSSPYWASKLSYSRQLDITGISLDAQWPVQCIQNQNALQLPLEMFGTSSEKENFNWAFTIALPGPHRREQGIVQ